jgi:hypothetical protein
MIQTGESKNKTPGANGWNRTMDLILAVDDDDRHHNDKILICPQITHKTLNEYISGRWTERGRSQP